MLVRRVRERFNERLLCIGTSATMASEGSPDDRDAAVADVASRLFGAAVDPDNIVSETLRPVTDHSASLSGPDLRTAMERGVPSNPTYETLAAHPVAAWVERNLGLEEQGDRLVRISRPLTILQASERLAGDSGLDAARCRDYLANFLLTAHQSRNEQGQSFFAFRLHQFISGAWNTFTTLEAPNERYLTLHGQQFKPGDRSRALFPLVFCRACGQEYLPVWARLAGKQPHTFFPRDLSERSHKDEDVQPGYLMPDPSGLFDPEDIENQYPEDWLEFRGDEAWLKPHFRQYRPRGVRVDTRGTVSEDGLPAWHIRGAFRFCLHPDCDAHYDGSLRSDMSKLSGLSSEGRLPSHRILHQFQMSHSASGYPATCGPWRSSSLSMS